MYDYFDDKELLDCARRACSSLMHELEDCLREKGVKCQFFLIGSQARNAVLRNGNGPIDFDYNLNILPCPCRKNGRALKEDVRLALNKVMRNHDLFDVEDSTSSLTTKPMSFEGEQDIFFTMDVAIVNRDEEGNWHRLIHDKRRGAYYWVPSPNSKGYEDKAKAIKTVPGWWDYAREHYKDKKNFYLRQNDSDHPSFLCWIEAINDVYNQMHQKGLL